MLENGDDLKLKITIIRLRRREVAARIFLFLMFIKTPLWGNEKTNSTLNCFQFP